MSYPQSGLSLDTRPALNLYLICLRQIRILKKLGSNGLEYSQFFKDAKDS